MDELDEIINDTLDKYNETPTEETSTPQATDEPTSEHDSPVDTASTKQDNSPEPENKADMKAPKDALSDDVKKRQHAFQREIAKAIRKEREANQLKLKELEDKVAARDNEIARLLGKERKEGLTPSENRKLAMLEGERDEALKTDNSVDYYSPLVEKSFNGNQQVIDIYKKSVEPHREELNSRIREYQSLATYMNSESGCAYYVPTLMYLRLKQEEGADIDDILEEFDDSRKDFRNTIENFLDTTVFGTKPSEPEAKPRKTVTLPDLNNHSIKTSDIPTKEEVANWF